MKILRSCLFLSVALATTVQAQVPGRQQNTEMEVDALIASDESGPSFGYYHENGKYGIVVNDSHMTEAIFDNVDFAREGFIVKKDGQFGFYGKNGKEVLAVKYDSIYNCDNEFLVAVKDKKCGLMTADGVPLLPFKYKAILHGNARDMFVVEDPEGQLQLVGRDGKILETHFDQVSLYQNGAILRKGGKHGLVMQTIHTGFVYDSIPVRELGTGGKQRARAKSTFRVREHLNNIVVLTSGGGGIIDTLGNLIVPAEYEVIINHSYKNYYELQKGRKQGVYLPACRRYFPADYDLAYMDGISFIQLQVANKKGLLNAATGEIVLPIDYDNILFWGDVYVITQGKKSGILDKKGNLLFRVEYDKIEHLGGSFSTGFNKLYRVHMDTLVGVLYEDGSWIIPARFKSIEPFGKNFLRVNQNNLYGLYNKQGEEVQPPVYSWISDPATSDVHVIFTVKNKLHGALDLKGKVLLGNTFVRVSTPANTTGDLEPPAEHGDKVLEHSNGMFGVLNVDNAQMKIPVVYEGIYQLFENGQQQLFLVKKAGKFGIVDDSNRVVVPFQYDSLNAHMHEEPGWEGNSGTDGIMALKGGKWGVISLNNTVRIPFQYKSILRISESGLFRAKADKHYVLINCNNKVLNPGPFDEISQFEYFEDNLEGIEKAMSFYKGKMRVIDSKGRFLTEPVAMQPHTGFGSFAELKQALTHALNSKDDTLLYHFAARIAPSDHLMYFVQETNDALYAKYAQYEREQIIAVYYLMLLDFKYSTWSSPYFDRENLLTEDFTVYRDGYTTNARVWDWAYDDTRILEKILRNSIKINGYWISSCFTLSYFSNRAY